MELCIKAFWAFNMIPRWSRRFAKFSEDNSYSLDNLKQYILLLGELYFSENKLMMECTEICDNKIDFKEIQENYQLANNI